MRGTDETFVVETLPAGAQVTTSLGQSCAASPCAFTNVPGESDFTVTVALEGYQTETRTVSHRLAGGGVVAAGANSFPAVALIGVAVDATNGATQSLTPNPLRVQLLPITAN